MLYIIHVYRAPEPVLPRLYILYMYTGRLNPFYRDSMCTVGLMAAYLQCCNEKKRDLLQYVRSRIT